MKRRIPTINELLALECVARHLNITDAAHELCVTPSAVSRQVTGIEQFFGTPLLHRHGKRFALTHAGRSYLEKVQPALHALESASLELLTSRDGAGTINLASVPTFTARWLIPRLIHFSNRHPGITLDFRPHLAGGDPFPTAGVDAAIRYGAGPWPGVTSEYLVGREFIVVCSTALLKRQRRLRAPHGLAGQTLLQHHAVPTAWSEWCNARQVQGVNALAGPRFEQYAPLIRAVAADMGVGLVPRCLVRDELQSGELVEPFESGAALPYGHFLCYPKDRLDSPSFQSFRSWLLETCQKSPESGFDRWKSARDSNPLGHA